MMPWSYIEIERLLKLSTKVNIVTLIFIAAINQGSVRFCARFDAQVQNESFGAQRTRTGKIILVFIKYNNYAVEILTLY